MSIPAFVTKIILFAQGSTGPKLAIDVPWISTFDVVSTSTQFVILTVDVGSYTAGLYTRTSLNTGWQRILSFTDFCYSTSQANELSIVLNNSVSSVFSSGSIVWANGILQPGFTVGTNTATIWVVAEPLSSSNSSNVGQLNLIPNSLAAATTNSNSLQSLVSPGNLSAKIMNPGVYCFSSTIVLPSHTELEIGEGVVLVKLSDSNGSTNLFTNSDYTGGNTRIKIKGRGTLYFNANSYASVYAANPVDCPVLPAFMNSVPPVANYSSVMPYMNGIHFENCSDCQVDEGLTLMMASKYNLYGAKITNSLFDDLTIYSDDTVNPANGSTYGRDGIHIQGNSSKIKIRNIKGCVNDDGVVLNVRDIPGFTTSNSVGPITDSIVEDIKIKNQRRSGSTVAIYGGKDTRTSSKDTPPNIVSVTQSGRTVTVGCDGPHNMNPGAAFDITSSNPSAYNISFGRVQTVGSSTSFTFLAPSGAGTYVSGATLTRYYQLSGLTVRNIRGNTHESAIVSMSCTTDVSNYGVIDQPIFDDVSGTINVPSGNGTFSSNYMRMVDLTISNPSSRGSSLVPLIDFTQNNSKLVGSTKINNPTTEVPYAPSSSSGQCWLNINNYDDVLISGGHATVEDGGGGWVQAISCGSPTGTLKIDGFKVEPSVPGGSHYLIRPNLSANFGTVVVQGCQWSPGGQVLHLDGSLSGGSVFLLNNTSPSSSAPVVNNYGAGIKFSLQGNDFSGSSNGIIYAGQSIAVGTYVGAGNNLGTSNLFYSGSDSTATGGSIVNSADFLVDVTAIARKNGAIVNNNNASAGSLGSAGLVVCQGTSSGSWKLMASPISAFY